jgi:hypothetical protein
MIRIRKLSDLEISTERSFLRDRRHVLLIVGEKQIGYLKLTINPKNSAAKKKKSEDDSKEEMNQGFL